MDKTNVDLDVALTDLNLIPALYSVTTIWKLKKLLLYLQRKIKKHPNQTQTEKASQPNTN